ELPTSGTTADLASSTDPGTGYRGAARDGTIARHAETRARAHPAPRAGAPAGRRPTAPGRRRVETGAARCLPGRATARRPARRRRADPRGRPGARGRPWPAPRPRRQPRVRGAAARAAPVGAPRDDPRGP